MYCGTCGAPLAPGAHFCGQCGAALTTTMPASPGAAQASPSPVVPVAPLTPPSARPFRPAPGSMLAPTLPAAPPPRVSPFVAGLLECLVPGVGLLYAGSILAGILVLAGTLVGGGLLLLLGLGLAGHARPAIAGRYFLFVLFALLSWLVVRASWAVHIARAG